MPLWYEIAGLSVCLSFCLLPPPHLVCSCTVYARVARHVTRHPPKRILFLSLSLPLSLSQASKANKQTGNQAKQANKQPSNQAINLIVPYMGRWLLLPPLLLLLPLRAIVAISMHICLRRTRCVQVTPSLVESAPSAESGATARCGACTGAGLTSA